ncbi:MAG TPA: rhodanese-like domain-containing protein [Candidatus Babeliales bacterium]|nr:rhodanese-like domain-containing protein [Candidatus Babeliales bacterium]
MKIGNFIKEIAMMAPNKVTLGVILVGIATLSACQWFGSSSHHEHKPSLVVVNVLDKQYYDDAHIAGSINVPLEELENYVQKNLGKDTEIVIYCGNYKCLASSEGAKMLTDLGYNHVWAYEGGTAEWKQLGFPINGAGKEVYLNDLEKPEGMTHEGVNMITAQELKEKIEKHAQKRDCC